MLKVGVLGCGTIARVRHLLEYEKPVTLLVLKLNKV